jgi:hypothetical protein
MMVQSPSSTESVATSPATTTRSTRLALGITVVTLLILLTVIGASAEHGAGAAELRRGPASVVLSVLITLAGLAGIASLALLFWGLVTRNRRSLNGSAPRRHSPVLIAGVLLAMFACLSGLLALAARRRHSQSFAALSGVSVSHASRAVKPLPFNAAASFATSGIIVGVIVLFVAVRLVRSIGWRRALRRLGPLASEDPEADLQGARTPNLESLGIELAGLSVADPTAEPDPRRAVIACYLQLLEVAARHGPGRQSTETPTEYLRRVLAVPGAAAGPAICLTGLFERARYSRQPIDEPMRSDAIAALGALQESLLLGVVV